MITVGIDLSAQSKKTALCRIEWSGSVASIKDLKPSNVTDDEILDAAAAADRVGIDVPFGWPHRFLHVIQAHAAGAFYTDELRPEELRWRATDRYVNTATGLRPLSVSTDKIGAASLRWVRIEKQWRERGNDPIDRTGDGRFVEVYPAAALVRWELRHQGYKGAKNRGILAEMVENLRDRLPALDVDMWADTLSQSDDAFDSLVCALIARAAALGLTEPASIGIGYLPPRKAGFTYPAWTVCGH